jgi:hypothetical protein
MAITVPAEGQIVSATTFGKPVADEVNRLTTLTTPPAWIPVTTFQNGWSNFDAVQVAAYRKIGDLVYLRGVIKGGTVPNVAFTLPAGYRPTQTCGFAVNANEVAGVINVRTSGTVDMQTGNPAYFWLTGIIFATS